MEITENQLHSIKQIYLPVLSERNIQLLDRTLRSHDQRGSSVSNDKVLFRRAVNETILREFQRNMKLFWTQHGVLFFPLNKP